MLGLAILLGFNLLGMLLQHAVHVPLPGNVIGLILLLIALWTKVVKLEWVERTANVFTKHMLLFFIPYVIGAAAFLHLLQSEAVAIVVSLVGSTMLVLAVTGFMTSKLQHKEEVHSHE